MTACPRAFKRSTNKTFKHPTVPALAGRQPQLPWDLLQYGMVQVRSWLKQGEGTRPQLPPALARRAPRYCPRPLDSPRTSCDTAAARAATDSPSSARLLLRSRHVSGDRDGDAARPPPATAAAVPTGDAPPPPPPLLLLRAGPGNPAPMLPPLDNAVRSRALLMDLLLLLLLLLLLTLRWWRLRWCSNGVKGEPWLASLLKRTGDVRE